MKRILLAALAAFFSSVVCADVALGPIVPATWTLYRSGSIALDASGKRLIGFTSEPDCFAKVTENTEQWKKGAVYYCKSSASRTSTWSAAPPSKPADLTKTVACVAPLVGSWVQTATWTLSGSKWVQGPFLPTSAPPGACTTPGATWTKLVDENASFTLTAPATVRFGSGSAWLQKDFKAGTFACTLTTFGSDPAVNVFKECDTSAAVIPPVVDPPPPPTGKLQVTRTTCTAPCAVLFDASGMGDFRDTYTFDFGDPKADTWSISGKSKNTEVGGPIAAHVYLTPGTFIAKVNGATATIAVADPAVTYAGAKTVCVGKAFAGCPAGAAQQGSLPSGAAWSGKRWLLHAGESFGDVSILDGNANVQVGAYGSGAKPVVSSVGVGNWRAASTNFASDVTVMDLAVKGGGVQQQLGARALFLRLDVSAPKDGIALSVGEIDYWVRGDSNPAIPKNSSAYFNSREVFFVECNALGDGAPSYGFWGDGSRIALLGSRLGNYQQHSVRFSALDRGVIAHNEIQGISADGIRLALKLHSMGFNAYTDGAINDTSGRGGWKTSKVVIANNLLGNASDNNAWTVAIAPQNNTVGEGLEDIIVESNTFIHGKNTSTDLLYAGRRITARGNAVQGGGRFLTGTESNPEVSAAWSGPNYIQGQ